MSVIPLVWGKTVVTSYKEYDAAGGLEGDVLLIENAQLSSLTDADDANISYDLHVGKEYRDHRDDGKKELLNGGAVKLRPGAAIIIETKEGFIFPKSMFGHIIPKVSLLQMGISNTSSKVDPGYRGNLLVTVFNLGKRTVKLRQGDPFCSLYVLQVGEGARPYNKPSKRIFSGGHRRSIYQAIGDLLQSNSVWILAALSVLTIVLTIFQIVQFLLLIH